MTLTAINSRFTKHRMLAVALAAVLCHSDITSALLETGKAGPAQKDAQGGKSNQNTPPLLIS